MGRWRRRPQAEGALKAEEPAVDPLIGAGQSLRQARESRGLNLRQLALETRISSPVLEALERGWRDRLPEVTYLRTMLPLLERHLELPSGSLEAAISSHDAPSSRNPKKFLVLRFTPGSIDVFTSWQGTWIYALLCLGLVYGLNLEQQRLAAAGLLAIRPLVPLAGSNPGSSEAAPGSDSSAVTKGQLQKLYPDLRPLDQAARGLGMGILGHQSLGAAAGETGQLLIHLQQPSQISLQSNGGQRVVLNGSQGEMVLAVTTPFRLKITTPAPQRNGNANRVEWNGEPLQPLAGHQGQFAVPPPPTGPPSTLPTSSLPNPTLQRP